MTKKEEREERKRRREMKKAEKEKRRKLREEKRRKKELARQFLKGRKRENVEMNRLPQAPRCEVCGLEAWCSHNFEGMLRRAAGLLIEGRP
jgi:hypothetical protein